MLSPIGNTASHTSVQVTVTILMLSPTGNTASHITVQVTVTILILSPTGNTASHTSAVDHYHTAVVTHWQHCCRSAVLSILSLLSISKSHQCYRLPSQCCVASWQHCKLSTIVTNTAVVTHRQHSVVLSKLLLPSIGKSYQSAFYYHHNVALPVGNTASLTVMQFIINLLLP